MSTAIRADEAARILGVSRATLYAYVSRGLVSRRTAVDGRTSLYDRAELEQLAVRSRQRRPTDRPTIDVRVTSAVTQLHDDRLEYRGHSAAELAATHSFEQVAELLWTGTLPDSPVEWPLDTDALALARRAVEGADTDDPMNALAVAAIALSGQREFADGATAARCLIALAPSLLGGPEDGTLAERVTALCGHAGSASMTHAVGTALILLADHELATSTLAVRVACSVRAHPLTALATGLMALAGPLHGTASVSVAELFAEAGADDPATVVARRLGRREHLPGFGHKVYRSGDPRLAPLMDAIADVSDPDGRLVVVEHVRNEAALRIGHQPNIDFGLGALLFVSNMRPDHPLFAIARLAGWGAHYDEEATERPVRYRGIARAVPA